METATSRTKYSQVAGLVHMVGQDCMMMSCYNVGFNYIKNFFKNLKNNLSCLRCHYAWLYVSHIYSASMEGSAARPV